MERSKAQPKTARQIERHFKGVASHRRIDILFAVAEHKDITLDDIAGLLRCNVKTTSEHTRRLVHAGLVNKRYRGREVIHSLSPYGKRFHSFLRSFSYS